MTTKLLFIAYLIICPLLAAASDGFAPGDFMFISGRIIGCDFKVRLVEFGEVEESGEVTLFENITFNVRDKTTSEVTSMLVDALEQENGYRSQTIRIIRTPGEDAKSRAMLLLNLAQERQLKCMKTEFPDIYEEQRRGYQLA